MPPGPVTVIVYVVVARGETWVEPFTDTSPTPLSIVAESASVEDQVNVEIPLGDIVVGSAEIVTVGGNGSVLTVTVTCAVVVPVEPPAVSVYVVVAVGQTA